MSDSLAELGDDTLLLTVNNRLARELMLRHAQSRIDAGLKAWSTPSILPWGAWLNAQYEVLLDSGYADRLPLNAHQEMLLWERVVRESRSGQQLLRPTGAARLARQTWQLLLDWRLSPGALDPLPDRETRLFLDWARDFETLCQQTNSLSTAELGAQICGALDEGVIAAPPRIRLAGFDNPTPLQLKIREALAEAGSDIRDWNEQRGAGEALRIPLLDREQEYLAAANWAKTRLARAPGARLAIVSPRLEEDREGLRRSLQQVLDPGTYLSGQGGTPLFNVSLGQPLADYPLVAHLLLALRLCLDSPLSLHEIGTLLRSPFIGGHAAEWLQRAALDARLRENGRPALTRRELLYQAQRQAANGPTHCPDLARRLLALQGLLDELPDQASPHDWAGHLLTLFDTLGWPGDESLDSTEYQQAERLRRAVSEFSTLTRVHYRLRLAETVRRFTRLCEDTEFQPRTPRAPVQVLGVLEAAVLDFDGLWVLGMDDLSWPPSPSPNPLLPFGLQREKDMPHASAERELQFARQLLGRLMAAAPEVLVSHPLREDERELRPSPLLAGLPTGEPEALGIGLLNPLYRACSEGQAGDPLPAADRIPLAQVPTGGAGLLTDQAACPFRAMAHHRLRARALPEPSHAPDPRLIGDMVHQLLERIWQHLQDSRTLHGTPPADLERLVDHLADQTLRDLARRHPDLYGEAFIELEKDRLVDLALAWLAYEAGRAQPFRVLACEQQLDTELVGLPLHVKIDRIDELADGSRVIIDYKTGSRVSAASWTGERPGEPQVPLYCISHDRVAAAILAQVHRKTRRMHGLARQEDIAPGVRVHTPSEEIPDWDALLSHWRTQLEHLAAEILDGLAKVAPKDRNACDYCDLAPLCRVKAGTAGSDGDGDD